MRTKTHNQGRLEKGLEIYESQLAFEAEKERPDWPPHQQLLLTTTMFTDYKRLAVLRKGM
jgi:hypothetical protein